MKSEKYIYLSSEIRKFTLIIALGAALFIIAILLFDRSNPHIYFLIITLIFSTLIFSYFSKNIVLNEKGIIFNNKEIEWGDISSIEKDDGLILRLHDKRKIVISNKFDSFYEIVSHVKNHRKDLFNNSFETDFNDSYISRCYIPILLLCVIITGVAGFFNYDSVYFTFALSFISLSIINVYYNFDGDLVILEKQSIIIKHPFRANLNRNYYEIENLDLISQSGNEIVVIKFSDGKKRKVSNHSNNCQFLYDNLISIKNDRVLVKD